MTPRSRRALVWGAVVVALFAVAVGAWLVLPPQPDRAVAVPGDDAEPVEVVRAYLEALDAHDCDTARALSTPVFAESATSWCTGLRGLEVLEVGEAIADDPATRGLPASADVVMVPTQIEADWRWLHDDGSFGDGPTGWGYVLVRDDGAWRIRDNGVG